MKQGPITVNISIDTIALTTTIDIALIAVIGLRPDFSVKETCTLLSKWYRVPFNLVYSLATLFILQGRVNKEYTN